MEIRGIWITTTDSKVLNSRQSITEAIAFLAATGFNVIFPVVWKNAATLYPSRVMRETFGIEIDPIYRGRDPLAEVITAAQQVGLAVVPWFEYGFASSFDLNGGPILAKKPAWAARDSSGNLLRKNGFEWLNAFDPEVQEFLLSLVLEVVRNYDIAGIQGDDRLPALPSEGGYDAKTVERYRQQFNQPPPPNPKDPQWLQWRADILTDFFNRLYREVIAFNPNLVISSAPSPYAWGYQEYLQDAQAWIDLGLVDLLHPQLYRRDFGSYKQLVDKLVIEQLQAEQLPQLVPGILLKSGGYRISPEHLLQAIAYNRSRGLPGEVFFFYEGLREDNDALAKALKAGPYAQPTPFNRSEVKAQGFTHRRAKSQYNYLDKQGKPVIQPQFDWAEPFAAGLARVKLGYKWGYINRTGKLISRLQFDDAAAFTEGLALVKVGSKYGYIDSNGKFAIAPQFAQAHSFSGKLAAVQVNGKYGYIDPTGRLAIAPQFDQVQAFAEGLSAVKINGKWGYIDPTGKLVIQPQFEDANTFANGLAPINLSNKFGYIDKTGRIAISPQFDQAQVFAEGLAAVRLRDKWGYINSTGKLVVPLEFDEAEPFTEGLAVIRVGSKYGYIQKPK